jgi:hypothetical protein
MRPFIKHVYLAFTADSKLRRLLNSEDTSSQGKVRRNQELHDLAEFFNCEVGGIPPQDFTQSIHEKLNREIKQAAKEAREQIVGIATSGGSILAGLGAIIAGMAAVGTLQFTANWSKKQFTSELRPFVVVADNYESRPAYSFRAHPEKQGEYRLSLHYVVKNIGVRAAHEYGVRTEKVLLVAYPKRNGEVLARPETRDAILEDLFQYFSRHPNATDDNVLQQFASRGAKLYGTAMGSSLQRLLVIPEGYISREVLRDVGKDPGQELAEGGALLIFYVHVRYEGSMSGSTYWTSYLGYFDDSEGSLYHGQARTVDHVRLSNYRQWTEREKL